ncbi:MAG: hypothetical protein K6C12_05640 [Oscillospiraceae bacterium]|nr:hypothetical protein [Oscillospiraceae bacterium]
MKRENAIRDVNIRIEHLARLEPHYRLNRAEEYNTLRNGITDAIRTHGINVRQELEPHVYNLYRRYFD